MKEERVVEGRLGRSPAALARGWPRSRDNRRASWRSGGLPADWLRRCNRGRAEGCVPRLEARLRVGMALRVDIPNLEVEWMF